jgi:hypothetical protein
MASIQQELAPQPREAPDDDMDEGYDEEPRRHPWGAIASVVLALALVFVGYQWNQAAARADALAAQATALRAEAETQRLRAEDAQRQADLIQKRLVALTAERESLAERIASLEKAAQLRAVAKAEKPRPGVAAPAARPRATPVATRPGAPRRAP